MKLNFWKYNTFVIFLIILIIWSFLFSWIKYFIWQNLSNWIKPDLQQIAWYLSLGSIFAYLLGWAFSYAFLKRYLLFFLAIWVLLILLITYFLPINSFFYLAFVIALIGFFYGIWVVLRWVIASIEIQKTWMKDTKLNAIVNILFIIFIILWTILGSKFYELYQSNWVFILLWLLVVLSILSLFLDYDKVSISSWVKSMISKKYLIEKHAKLKESFKIFIPEFKYIWQNFSYIILTSAFLWAIITVVSQKAIELSVNKFHMEASSAGMVLLFSSIGAILWNILSSFLKNRWRSFFILNSFVILFILWFLIFSNSFFEIWVLAFLLGIVFWASSNLIDGYYLKIIWEKDKREYGSSANGLFAAIVLAFVMFSSSFIDRHFWFNILIITLVFMLVCVNIWFYYKIER